MKILVVDDEEDIREILQYNLKKEGYETYVAKNGQEGIEQAKLVNPDLILLDIMMPGMDGIEVCDVIRKEETIKKTIICFLTARGEDYSQIAGFEAGADDFVTKPIKPKVLISRINALLRRNQNDQGEASSSRLIIDKEKYHVELDGNVIRLPRKEFKLLALLASKPGVVFEREEILESVWGSEIVVGDRTIDVHIRKLREKIGDEFIMTVKGVGYKFQE